MIYCYSTEVKIFMRIENLDKEYLKIVFDILNDKEFLKLKTCEHHGITRYDHSLKVSYQAYQFAKKHSFDYKSAAIGGLLHDFFLTDDDVTQKDKFLSVFTHPKLAQANALMKYDLNDKESDIIVSHMFPINLKLPRYKESWIVSLYDKKIALKEWGFKFNNRLKYSTNLAILLLFNFMR